MSMKWSSPVELFLETSRNQYAESVPVPFIINSLMLTLPATLFALLIASLYGALYHLMRGGGPGWLLLYLLFSWFGFALGHLLGVWLGIWLFPLGALNLGVSTLGSLIVLLLGDWIGHLGQPHTKHLPGEDNRV